MTNSNLLIAGCKNSIIPDGVTGVDNGAFENCIGLTAISIPSSVISIGGYAFRGCSGLTSITIPNSVTTIGDEVFYNCSNLTSVAIPNSVTSISSNAFSYCSGLTSINIPNSVTTIGDEAFYNCSNLTSVTIPNSVKSIGNYAFSGCSGLTSISIPNSMTSIGDGNFSGCSGLASVTIPNSVKSIGNYAFSGCSSLTSITIPNSVTSIGSNAFSGCSSLTTVKVDIETPLPITASTFTNKENATLIVPKGSKSAYEVADYWKEFKEIIDGSDVVNETTYSISSALDLVAFANDVNAGANSANAFLTADIDLSEVSTAWIPVGSENRPYKGTFDGQGHTITNFEYTATSDYNGLFGVINNATVKNFCISGTLTSQKDWNGVVGRADGASVVSGIHSSLTIKVSNYAAHSGGVVGGSTALGSQSHIHTVLVEGCEYSGTLTHNGVGDCQAGILGYTNGGGVKNCIFSGTIIGENSYYGGILGYCKNIDFIGVQNCLSVGKIVTDDNCTFAAAIIGNWNGNVTANVKNNYYYLQEGSTTTIAIGNKASNCEAPHAVTTDQLANGEICYALNGDQTEINWYQTLGNDDYPVLDNSHLQVKSIDGSYTNDVLYSITFDSDGGSQIESISQYYGSAITSPDPPTKEGYTFIGWEPAIPETMPIGGLTVVAQWQINSYTLTYMVDGEEYKTATVVYGSEIIPEEEPCKDGYTFGGWNGLPETMPAQDVEVTGWFYLYGDVNTDENVNVVDVVDIARFVVATPSEKFREKLADLNADNNVNIGDAVTLVNHIAGDQNFVKAWVAPSQTVANDVLCMSGSNGILSLNLENECCYTAFQLDLYVAESSEVSQMMLNAGRRQGHQLLYNKIEEGHYRVAALSTSNHAFIGNDGELLNITMNGASGDEVSVRNIRFFDAEGHSYLLEDVERAITTSVNRPTPDPSLYGGEIYDLQGRKREKVQRGVNIVGGKKMIVK